MNNALRRVITVLAMLSVPAVVHADDHRSSSSQQLVITHAHVDPSTHRLIIRGQHLTDTGRRNAGRRDLPVVTLNLQPMVVERANAYEIVVAPLSPTYPEGTHLLTVARGSRDRESAAFIVAV